MKKFCQILLITLVLLAGVTAYVYRNPPYEIPSQFYVDLNDIKQAKSRATYVASFVYHRMEVSQDVKDASYKLLQDVKRLEHDIMVYGVDDHEAFVDTYYELYKTCKEYLNAYDAYNG